MRYVAAYLLASLGGAEKPTDKDIQKILTSVGIDVNELLVKKVISELQGKCIEELLAEGSKKLASMPSAAAVGGSAAPAAGSTKAEPTKEVAKETPKEEEEEEEDGDMGFGLFD